MKFSKSFCAALFVMTQSAIAIEHTDLEGIYEVSQAFLNESHCDEDGRVVEYASRYFRVNKTEQGLNIAICNGQSLMELQCMGGYRSTNLESTGQRWSGYQYGSKRVGSLDHNPGCQLHAFRRTIIPMNGGLIRYERSDWSENMKDFIAECNEDMAAEYQQAQSLKCNSHISIIGKKILDFME